MDLNENHKRHLMTTFRHIDKLLYDMTQLFSGGNGSCLFQPTLPDITHGEQEDIRRKTAEFRLLMAEVLQSLDIEIGPPDIGARHAALNSLAFVEIALEELKSRHMRGYGELPEGSTAELDEVVSRMQRAVRRIRDEVSGRPDG